ncbi:GNAT family N-acetyltransferase [Maribacter polysiphoniae]|uniref:Acetyltransferase (GNAT) family protein n=1 Tax=Maribacter polysiphoniae TaxID=429344 RepID=A0A316DST4_9FLAO|nr:GNAT family N-acetyltransferase [Maribacter polysiphoniae]MBD1262692.1 GNAT family N-acetyltransferase [Maribacter polysiphoniae]PWK21104.1 acetyltransferase (GNAT) family protein [Maribacter polysiphoniae]
MIEIIREKEIWDNLVKKCDFADFYHTYDYHHAAKANGEEPVLIHYSENGKSIVLPLLFRKIHLSIYKDATSVYGYPGPITNDTPSDFNINLFQKELNQCFKEQKIISVFSRLNAFIPYQESCLLKLGNTESLGSVVYIDLDETIDKQWKLYNRRLRTYINKSRTIYKIKNADIPADLDSFIELYYENMRRVKANKAYFFDKKYFLDLINSSDFETEVLLAISIKTGDVAGGAMFIKKNKIIQYHLSGASQRYLDLNPIKLLIDEMRIRGKQEHYSYLNLGGGVGAKEDSLFYFKSGFSKYTLPFKVWKYKVNPTIYEDLVQQRNDIHYSDETLQYFPRYRVNQ